MIGQNIAFVLFNSFLLVDSETAVKYHITALGYDTEGQKRLYGPASTRQLNKAHLEGESPTKVFDKIIDEMAKLGYNAKTFKELVQKQPVNETIFNLDKPETEMENTMTAITILKQTITAATNAGKFEEAGKLIKQLQEMELKTPVIVATQKPTVVSTKPTAKPITVTKNQVSNGHKLFVFDAVRHYGETGIKFGMILGGTNVGVATSVAQFNGEVCRRNIKAAYANRIRKVYPSKYASVAEVQKGDIIKYVGTRKDFIGCVGFVEAAYDTKINVKLYRMTDKGLVLHEKLNKTDFIGCSFNSIQLLK